jgi:A/G-specific adenine glycosylase
MILFPFLPLLIEKPNIFQRISFPAGRKTKIVTFTKAILAWYRKNSRDLPWRKTDEPYLIWISEIIMQQTRIGQGLGYYSRFIERFPSVAELAKADEEDVLKTWQGLGYYSRARNLHKTAKEIVENHNGKFPDSYEKLITLKGIGEYTAAAILSIAYNHPYPAIDGNVLRFFSRYFGIHIPVDTLPGKRKIHEKMLLLIDRKQPGIFNQAIMEFGALKCKPVKPDCRNCPFKKECLAFLEGNVGKLPVKSKPKKQKTRYFNYLVILWKKEKGEKFLYLRKREGNDVWKNLYDFPMIETIEEITEEKLFSSSEWMKINGDDQFRLIGQSHQTKHILTHQVIYAKFYIIQLAGRRKPGLPYLPVPIEEIVKYPVPRLIEEFFNEKMVSF